MFTTIELFRKRMNLIWIKPLLNLNHGPQVAANGLRLHPEPPFSWLRAPGTFFHRVCYGLGSRCKWSGISMPTTDRLLGRTLLFYIQKWSSAVINTLRIAALDI